MTKTKKSIKIHNVPFGAIYFKQEFILQQIGVKCKNKAKQKTEVKKMLHSGDIENKGDVSISRLTNSIYFFVDTCFIMYLSGNAQGKNRYRLLAFHESEKKIFVDKYYPTLKGARIAFTKKFKNMACNDNVSPHWSFLYTPDRDWIEEMLSFAENAKIN